ncbi:MAG: hypothetical protein VYD64_00240, partial [Pseudomonadota bacterium]|nr:hypothetical protein [Pseudomonadota bacterium]
AGPPLISLGNHIAHGLGVTVGDSLTINVLGRDIEGRITSLRAIDWSTLGTIFKREADNLLIKFGMKEDRITSLSGGNQQKVLIGRGFAMRPDIIVLNDPARGIDVGAKNELYRHLRNVAGEGKSVVYMSSELEEFIGFATRVIVFRNGRPFDAFGGCALDPKKLLEAMFGQTDGSGLEAPWGLKQTNGTNPDEKQRGKSENVIRSSADGVRVHVDVPDRVRAEMAARTRNAAAAVAMETPSISPKINRKPKPGDTQHKTIRVVEFDAESGEARQLTAGGR